MRNLLVALAIGSASLQAQTAPPPAAATPAALTHAIIGRWTGILEYRDYSEPAASTKRVQLPTWLTISSAPEGVLLDYTYDDGPGKTVVSHSTLFIDTATGTYKVTDASAAPESSSIAGLGTLRDGLGTLVLSGQGTDNKLPAEIRTTWTIRRNLLSWLEEVRPSGSNAPFAFRHRYTFTRAEAPLPPPHP